MSSMRSFVQFRGATREITHEERVNNDLNLVFNGFNSNCTKLRLISLIKAYNPNCDKASSYSY